MSEFNIADLSVVTQLTLYLDWANIIVPLLGLVISFYALFSKRYCTETRTIGASIHLFIAIWVLLLWSDFGPVSRYDAATVASRYVGLAINILILVSVRRKEKIRVKVLNRKSDSRSSEKA